jgi:polar amino acid transport system substrate-binding protein
MNLRTTIFALLAVFLLSGTAIGQSIINNIIKSGEIRVGMTGTQPPFSMKTNGGAIIGYEVDLATMLAEGMGVKVKIVEMPFALLLDALDNGEIDVVMSNITITTARNLKVAFKGPYMISGKSILTKTPTLKTVTSPAELNNSYVKIATLKGSTSESYANKNTPQAILTLVDNYDQGIEMIRNGTVDLLLADFAICAYSVLTNPDDGFYTLSNPLSIEPVGMALPASDPLFLNLIDNFFMDMQLDGTLDDLQQKWFNDGSWIELVK